LHPHRNDEEFPGIRASCDTTDVICQFANRVYVLFHSRCAFPFLQMSLLQEFGCRQGSRPGVENAYPGDLCRTRELMAPISLEAAANRVDLIVRLGMDALTGTSLDALLDRAVGVVVEGLAVERAKVLQPEGGELKITHGKGWHPGVVGHARLPRGLRSPPGAAFDSAKPVAVRDLRTDPCHDYSALLREHHVLSLVNVPVLTRSTVWGVLEADATEARPFDADDVRFLVALAQLLGVAIERQAAEQAQSTAMDALAVREHALQALNDTLEERVRERTEQRERAEAAVARSRKMDALGRAAAGIVHDFRNVLNTATMSLAVVEGAKTESDRSVGVHLLKKSLQKGAAVSARLLSFARQAPGKIEQLSLKHCVEGVVELARHSLPSAIDLRVEVSVDATVSMDRSEFDMALLNLMVNARDAMPDGGLLRVYVENAAAEPAVETGRSYVAVAVQDTGHGIPSDMLAHVLEPFFTTKDREHGTGLGLSQAYGFSRQTGGDLLLSSEIGVGTTVRMLLPVSAS
jgi:signal transduction histidine kinase